MVHAYFYCKQANVASLNHGLERKLADSNTWFAMMNIYGFRDLHLAVYRLPVLVRQFAGEKITVSKLDF